MGSWGRSRRCPARRRASARARHVRRSPHRGGRVSPRINPVPGRPRRGQPAPSSRCRGAAPSPRPPEARDGGPRTACATCRRDWLRRSPHRPRSRRSANGSSRARRRTASSARIRRVARAPPTPASWRRCRCGCRSIHGRCHLLPAPERRAPRPSDRRRLAKAFDTPRGTACPSPPRDASSA